MVQIGDRNRHHQKMSVNEDGSINTNQSADGTKLTLQEIKQRELSEILGEILQQLKIMNLHLSILTDNTMEKTEVE